MANTLSVKTIFITGANRGIGLEFVKQLSQLPDPPQHLFATCRNPDDAKELQELAKSNASIHVAKLDTIDYASYPAIVEWVQGILGPDTGLNVLINNAAVKGNEHSSLAKVTRDAIMSEVEVNAVAPLMLTKAFLPLLQKAADAGSGELSVSRAAIINMTSRMGSIDDNTSGGVYPYRSSKVALNMITKSLSIDLKPQGILAVAIHPGHVITEMGGQGALITTATCVEFLLKVIAELNAESAGLMLNNKGEKLPW